MSKKILVAYASKYGSTTQIAKKIAEVLTQAGHNVDILSADQPKDISAYQAVILGSAVYYGRWHKSAVKFLKTNEAALTQLPVWFFSSGPVGEGDPVELLDGWQFPPLQQAIADRIQPRGITVFHGALLEKNLNFILKWMLNNLKSPVGDFRDWDTITGWAESVAAALK